MSFIRVRRQFTRVGGLLLIGLGSILYSFHRMSLKFDIKKTIFIIEEILRTTKINDFLSKKSENEDLGVYVELKEQFEDFSRKQEQEKATQLYKIFFKT